MLLNNSYKIILLSIALATCIQMQAATVKLGTSGSDPNNFSSFTAQTLTSVTLNGISYNTSELTRITLNAWAGDGGSQLLQTNGGSSNPTASERRGFLETDWSGNTGIINPSTTADSVMLTFNAPVVNIAGADLILYEINGASTADPFEININGNRMTVNGSEYGNTGATSAASKVLTMSTPATLTALLNNASSLGSSNISQDIFGVGIDFSDFGVAPGDTVSFFYLDSFGSNTFDPVIIAGVTSIPELSSIWLMGLAAGITLLFLKRRS